MTDGDTRPAAEQPSPPADHPGSPAAQSGTPVEQSRAPRSAAVFVILAGLLLVLLGTAIATQVKNTGAGDTLDSARPADLLVLLDNLNRREAALRQEIAALEQTLAGLEQEGSDAALAEAQSRLRTLSLQLGTVPATGPGVILTLTDPLGGVGADVLLDTIQELRAAGADTLQIAGADGTAVRIGTESWVTGAGGSITVDDRPLRAPYTITAIGDGPTLAAALNIPGGIVDTVARAGGTLTIEQSPQVEVPALREIEPRQYSQPGN